MISNLRRLFGATSRELFWCLRHFSGSGPGDFGIERADHGCGCQFHQAEKDRGRDGAVAKEKQPGENPSPERKSRLEPVIIQAERLEKTRRPMVQVQGKQEERKNIKP